MARTIIQKKSCIEKPKITFLNYVYAYVSLCGYVQVPMESRRYWIACSWSYSCQLPMWVLGAELWFSVRAEHALNY